MISKLVKEKQIIPPNGGFKENAYYLVWVSFSSGNPVHKCIFFTGFLDEGYPAGYNALFNPTYEYNSQISEVHYMKAIREINMEVSVDSDRETGKKRMDRHNKLVCSECGDKHE